MNRFLTNLTNLTNLTASRAPEAAYTLAHNTLAVRPQEQGYG